MNASNNRVSMSAPAKVTIVTICRNVLHELKPTLESVLSSEDVNIDYLVVDGASTDGTLLFLQSQTDSRFRFISEPDAGISDAMNKGIRHASGDWIMHLHAGDSLLGSAMEVIRDSIRRNSSADVICCSIVKVEPTGSVLCESAPERLKIEMSVPHPGVVAKTSVWLDNGGFDTSLKNAMDYDLFLRCALKGVRFVAEARPIATFSSGGQSENSLWETLKETHKIRRNHLTSGWSRSTGFLVALWIKGQIRVQLQRHGMNFLVLRYRSRFAYPRKSPVT
jgi:glycosyltransferase involved in cell wall biosynthesis